MESVDRALTPSKATTRIGSVTVQPVARVNDAVISTETLLIGVSDLHCVLDPLPVTVVPILLRGAAVDTEDTDLVPMTSTMRLSNLHLEDCLTVVRSGTSTTLITDPLDVTVTVRIGTEIGIFISSNT